MPHVFEGHRQKVALIAALASDVELFLLDEPTSGLDSLMEATCRDCVSKLRNGGRTVLLSSHILSEVEALCDRVSVIPSGAVVETGSIASMRHLTRTVVQAEVQAMPAGLSELPGVHEVVVTGNRISASVEPVGHPGLLAALGAAGITSLTSSPPTLEELFLRHYESAPR